jgi:Fe-S oxidoreductase
MGASGSRAAADENGGSGSAAGLGLLHGHGHYDQLVAQLETGDYARFVSQLAKDRRLYKQPLRSRNGDTALHVLCHKGNLDGVTAILRELIRAKQRER